MEVLGHGTSFHQIPTLVLDRVRRGNYPAAGDPRGMRRPIPLRDGDSILEPTYISFIDDNVVGVLKGSDGPHAQRLAEYLRDKLNVKVTLAPVLRENLDEILQELQITTLDIAIRPDNFNRDLFGGDWVHSLDAAAQLANDGVIRLGLSVGRRGSAEHKRGLGERFRTLLDGLRTSAGLNSFDTVKVGGKYRGNPQVIDLLADRLVETVVVEDSMWFDHEESLEYATGVLTRQLLKGRFSQNAETTANQGDRRMSDLSGNIWNVQINQKTRRE